MSTRHQSGLKTTVNRRNLLRAAGLSGSAMLIAAGAAPALRPGRLASAQEVTLTFWLPGGSQIYCDAHREIADDYMEANPHVTIGDIPCGTGEEEYVEVLLARIAAGNPPDATVIWDTPVSLGARGALTALDEFMQTAEYAGEENWPSAILASCQFQGQTYGLPATAGTYGMWFNQELFEEKGIPSGRDDFPKTWDELRQLSKEFTHWDGDRLEVVGFVPWHGDIQYTLPIWSALNGSQIYDADNQQYTIDDEANVAMMEYWVEWLDEEYQGDLSKVLQSGSWGGYTDPTTGQPPAFQEGRQAAFESGSWLLGDLYATLEPEFEHWDVAPYPVGPGGTESVSGYWPNWLVIPEGAPNVEEAFSYLDYMSGVGVEKWFDAVPDMPINTLVELGAPRIVVERRGQEFAEDVMAFFRHQADVSTRMWDSPVQSFANDQLERALERIMHKVDPPQEALAEAQSACQSELDRLLGE